MGRRRARAAGELLRATRTLSATPRPGTTTWNDSDNLKGTDSPAASRPGWPGSRIGSLTVTVLSRPVPGHGLGGPSTGVRVWDSRWNGSGGASLRLGV